MTLLESHLVLKVWTLVSGLEDARILSRRLGMIRKLVELMLCLF